MNNAISFLLLALALLAAPALANDAIVGVWVTEPDPEDGNAHVEILQEGDGFRGRLVWLQQPVYPPGSKRGEPGTVKIDNENPDPKLRDRPLQGLWILEGFGWDARAEQWSGGTIYDPDNGKTYKAKIWLDGPDTLKVRGYVGFSLLGRNTEWKRLEPDPETESPAIN